VGHEDGETSKPLIYYAEPLLRFAEKHPDIPFLFHAGETLGDGTAADMNLYDAILLGAKRIGHGLVVRHEVECSCLLTCRISTAFRLPNIPN